MDGILITVACGIAAVFGTLMWGVRRDLKVRPMLDEVEQVLVLLLDKRLEKFKLEWKAHQIELEDLYGKFTRMWGRQRRYMQVDKRDAVRETSVRPLTLSDLNRILVTARSTGTWPTSSLPAKEASSRDSSEARSGESSPAQLEE